MADKNICPHCKHKFKDKYKNEKDKMISNKFIGYHQVGKYKNKPIVKCAKCEKTYTYFREKR